MPKSLGDNELEGQVEMQADQYIPFPMEEVSYDFQVIGPSEKDPEMLDVLLVATRTENVEQRQAAVQAAGLTAADRRRRGLRARERLQAADAPDARRRHRPHHRGRRLRREQHDLQRAARTCKVIYTRDFAFGGQQLTEEIMRTYGLSAWKKPAAPRRKAACRATISPKCSIRSSTT